MTLFFGSKIMKFQKPIKTDASFLYICPNDNCNIEHWIYLREAKIKNFKVVCYCGTVFKVKQILSITINYEQIKSNIQQDTKTTNTIISLPIDMEEKCVKLLTEYGFTNNEAKELLLRAYNKNQTSSPAELIKLSLQLLEINNV